MKLCLHVGYAKTGTSFLQTEFFPKIKEINYLGKFYNMNRPKNNILELNEIIHDILLLDSKSFNQKKKFLIIKLSKISLDPKKMNVISNEAFTSGVMSGTYKDADISRSIKRLKYICLKLKIKLYILIFIRNHFELILSSYNALYSRYNANYNKKLDLSKKKFFDKRNKIFLNQLNFFKTYKSVIDNVGPHNCKLFLYEEFFSNENRTIRAFFKFLKIKKVSKIKLNFKKKINLTSKDNIRSFSKSLLFLSSFLIKNFSLKSILDFKNYRYKINKINNLVKFLFDKYEPIEKESFTQNKEIIKKFYIKDLKKFRNLHLKKKLKKFDYL